MRVLQINSVCKSGSTGKIAYDLHSWLLVNGHESVIAYGRGKRIDDTNTYRFAPTWEVYLHAMLTRLTGWTGCFSPIATRNLLRFMDRFRPDVVHIHELHAYFVNIAPIVAYLKRKKIKTIWTFHCEFMYTGKCGYSYECDLWQSNCGNCPYVQDYPASMFFDNTRAMHKSKKQMFEGFDDLTIITPSSWLAERVRKSFLKDKKIVVIPNGIDTEVFRPRDTTDLRSKYNILPSQQVVIHVTSSFEDERKGGRYVLELARRMPNVLFFVVGNNQSVINVPSNLVAVGRTENQEQLAKWYSLADISLITSKIENFPTVCLESLCCGTPVVGFDGGGTAETAPDGYGVFVSYGDMSALEAMVQHALNGGLCGKEACTAFGQSIYSKEEMVQRYIDLYSRIEVSDK